MVTEMSTLMAAATTGPVDGTRLLNMFTNTLSTFRMNRRKADFKFAYKFLEDDV